jgi:hypothetical protein
METIDGGYSTKMETIDGGYSTALNPAALRRTSSLRERSFSTDRLSDKSPSNRASPVTIPVSDDEYGDFDLNMSSHKRKQSGVPLEVAEAWIARSGSKDSDEEEGSGRPPLARNVSFSDAAAYVLGKSTSTPPRMSSAEFDDLVDQENDGNGFRAYYNSSTKLLSTRNILILTFITVMAFLFNLFHVSSLSKTPDISRPVEDDAQNKDGEEHFEGVGTPLEFYTEVNKVRYYKSPDKMEEMYSEGPTPADRDFGGLHVFQNVCLTRNIDAVRYEKNPTTALRGLIYFSEDQKENLKRCVPCSNDQTMDSWDGSYADEKFVKHKCGMTGLHTMYATSAGDWSNCIMKEENFQLMKEFRQTQIPTDVTTVHFFQAPTFLLQFNALDLESALFDMLMTYIPFMKKYHSRGEFPFESLISHSVQGCLSHSHHPFCELLHQLAAFGSTQEIPWEADEKTLYCYKTLYYNQVGYNKYLEHEGHVTKETFGGLRDNLFIKFGLPRKRTVEDRAQDAKVEGQDLLGTKIIFYDKKSKEQTHWTDMEDVIAQAKLLEKYEDITFVTVKDFEDLSVAQQARMFNEADAIVMVHGQHMANAIYAVDRTSFVGVGCSGTVPLIGNPRFVDLMGSSYKYVTKCIKGDEDESEACIVCQDDEHFTMSLKAFENIVDGVMSSLKN